MVVAGVCLREPDPDPSATDDYRSTPLCLVVRAPAGGYLELRGAGQPPASSPTTKGPKPPRSEARPRWGDSWLFWTVLGVGVALAFWLLPRLW